MHRLLPPVEVAWSDLLEVTSPASSPKCDCKVRGYLESLSAAWPTADSTDELSLGVPVPLENVTFCVHVPGVCSNAVTLNASQVLLSPSRVYSGKASSKLSYETSEEGNDVARRLSDESRDGFNLGDCVEATLPLRNEYPDLARCNAEIILQGELVDVVDETTFHFRHSHTGNTHLVTRDKLRCVSVQPRSLAEWFYDENGSYLTTAKVAVPNELSEWVSTPNLSGAFLFTSLWEKAGVLASVHETQDLEPGSTYSIVVYGTVDSVEHAQMLIANQIKSLLDAVTFQERRSRRLKLLEDRRGGQDSSERIEFFVHESLVGLVIGKQGENLARVARNYKVEVRVFPDENGVRRLRIYGSDPAKLDRAKAELDYHFMELPLPMQYAERFLEWMTSDKNMLRDSCNRHALHSLWYHGTRQSLVVCGLRRSIEDFIRTLDLSYKDAHRSPFAALKQTGGIRTSPTTAAVSGSARRTPASPPMAGPRPPILDALQKSSAPAAKGAAAVLREFPLSSAFKPPAEPAHKRPSRTSPLLRPLTDNNPALRPNWWATERSLQRRSPHMGASLDASTPDTAPSWGAMPLPTRYSSQQMMSGDPYYYCRPSSGLSLYPADASQMYYNPYDLAQQQQLEYARRKRDAFAPAPQQHPSVMMTAASGGYYWV